METIFKTRPNVPLQSLKRRDDCRIVLAFKIDCRPKGDSSIEIKACCKAHLVWVKFQLNWPSCCPMCLLGSPVPCLAAAGVWGSLSPPIQASHGLCPLHCPGTQLQTRTKPGFGEGKSSKSEISPAFHLSFPFPLLPFLCRSLGFFAVCC